MNPRNVGFSARGYAQFDPGSVVFKVVQLHIYLELWGCGCDKTAY